MARLVAIKGFTPYVLVLWLNAFVDLGHKILIQNTVFKVYDGGEQVVLTAVVNSLVLLPYILLFSPAGFCSDRWPKNQVMRVSAWFAVLLTLLITACYYLGWFWPAFAMTLLLASQSAMYAPAKYGYIRPLVGTQRLMAGNGVVQAATIVAILSGTLLFSILFEQRFTLVEQQGDKAEILRAFAPLGWLLVINCVIELVLTYRLPQVQEANRQLSFDWRKYCTGRDIGQALRPMYRAPEILICIIGLMGFWAVSQVVLAAFPAFAKTELGVVNTVVIQGVMAVSGLGIVVGALLAERATAGDQHHGRFELAWLPWAVLGMALCLLWLPILPSMPWHGLNFFLFGVLGGVFIVPLGALMQSRADEKQLGKVIAANNLLQNVAMFSCLILTAVFAYYGLAARQLLWMMVAVALVFCGYSALRLRRLH